MSALAWNLGFVSTKDNLVAPFSLCILLIHIWRMSKNVFLFQASILLRRLDSSIMQSIFILIINRPNVLLNRWGFFWCLTIKLIY